jgi:hypothetical protein
MARTTFNDCALNTLPQAIATGSGWIENGQDTTIGGVPHPKTGAYCNIQASWGDSTQFKLNGVLPLPWDFQVSGVFQNLPGTADVINRATATCALTICGTYTNAQIAPSLGRNLSAGATTTVSVPIVPPRTLYEDRLSQLDFRVTKIFKVRQTRLKANVDLYNALNSSAVTGVSGTYPAFLIPATIMQARFVRFSGQFDF